jgi:glycosyltransferase involved in cell wall biosynthesis
MLKSYNFMIARTAFASNSNFDDSTHKMRILWLSNKLQSSTNDNYTGGWLNAMAEALIKNGEVELANISRGMVTKITRHDFGEICQWIVPLASKAGPYSEFEAGNLSREIRNIINEYSPDLIHIWGTEDIWGLLTPRKFVQKAVLLETQGMKSAISRVFHGGLTISEQLACIGLKEILKGSTIFHERERHRKWESIDKAIISGHHFIAVQTEWMEAQVRVINCQAKIFRSDRLLRNIFYEKSPWKYSDKTTIFCSAAYPSPFKGLHVVIRAMAILKNHLPNVQLRIAGGLQKSGIRQDGYIAWLNREIKKLHLDSCIAWLGPISASQMADEIKSSAAMVLPSFIENCSNLMQEGMMIGAPLVVSYVGGLPSLARDEESVLFVPAGDEVMCAHQIERLILDQSLAERISHRAREIALERNNYKKVIQNQIDIYRQVIAEYKNGI